MDSEEQQVCFLWLNEIVHDHSVENTERNWGIDYITKKEIEKLFKSKVNGASRIKYALREMVAPTSVSYVKGITVPSPGQINNFANKKIIKPNFS